MKKLYTVFILVILCNLFVSYAEATMSFGSNYYNPDNENNIAYFLNNNLYEKLEYKQWIADYVWTTNSGETTYEVSCKIGLLSSGEANEYENLMPGYISSWCRNTPTYDDWNKIYVFSSGSSAGYVSFTIQPYTDYFPTRPSLYLKQGLYVNNGNVNDSNNGVPLHLVQPGTTINYTGVPWLVLDQTTTGTYIFCLSDIDSSLSIFPPSVPGYLYISNITHNSAIANWTASPGATSYVIYLDGVQYGTTSSTSYSITGLQPNTTYQVSVSAINSSGESGQCGPVSFTTLDIPPPPSAPSGLYVDNITKTSAEAYWTAVSGATGYYVYLDGVKIGSTTSTNYPMTGLQPGTTYQVSVSAINSGGEGSQCTPVPFTTLENPPSAPSSLYVDNITKTSAEANWTAVSGATGYYVYLDGVKIGSTTSTNYPMTDLQQGTTYQVSVSAINSGGEGSQCTPVPFTTEKPLWTPLTGKGMGFSVERGQIWDTFKFIFELMKGSIWPFILVFLALFVVGLLWKIWRRTAR